jgi:hypothetical protein
VLFIYVDYSLDIATPLIFSPGQVSGTMDRVIRISEDGQIEPDETFTLILQTEMTLVDLVTPDRTVVTITSVDGTSTIVEWLSGGEVLTLFTG